MDDKDIGDIKAAFKEALTESSQATTGNIKAAFRDALKETDQTSMQAALNLQFQKDIAEIKISQKHISEKIDQFILGVRRKTSEKIAIYVPIVSAVILSLVALLARLL